MSKAYMNPSIDSDSHGSPMDQAIRQHDTQQKTNNNALYLSSGKNPKATGGGRTLNIPKTLPVNQVPGPSYNGAVTIGEACIGAHCSIPVTPQVSNMINNNLRSANPPPGAIINYPGTVRLGNNSFNMPGVQDYVGTETNPGPFEIQCGAGSTNAFKYITHPVSRKTHLVTSVQGRKIINKYINGM